MKPMKTKFNNSVVGPLKPSVHKRGTRDNVGYITQKLLTFYFLFLSWIFSQDKATCFLLKDRILSIWQKNGSQFLVKYLKLSYLLLQKYVSGEKVVSTNEIPFSLVAGLPRIIPGPFRSEIRKANPVIIRMVLTALAVFRIIKCPGTLKLETITDPFKGLSETLPDYEVSQALRSVIGTAKSISDLSKPKYLFLMTAGPNYSTSWRGTWLDIKAWSESDSLPNLLNYIKLMGWESTPFAVTLRHQLRYCKELYPILSTGYLGKLSEKEEAAGKIRVFAITDCITQAVLRPLHKFLFQVLSKLETDGTFDQGAPLKRLLELKQAGELGSHKFWSYDLSAATDRLPVKLQAQVLNLMFGNTEIGESWRLLMIDRDWQSTVGPLRYEVGQPMGALSSWAMLALTHHLIVAIAARRVGIADFKHYALLGDDIVIANDLVANSYHTIMTETLGVEINLSKSLVSPTHFEYAKRLVSVSGELTPFGPKNLLLLCRTPVALISVLQDAIYKGFTLNEASFESLLSTFPFFRKRAIDTLRWAILGPFGLIPSESGLSSKLRLDNSLNSVAIDQLISAIDDTIHEETCEEWSKDLKTFNNVIRTFELKDVDTFLSIGHPVMTTDRVSFLRLCVDKLPKYQKFWVSDSSLFWEMRSTLFDRESKLLENKPVRRFIFNGPLIHFGHYLPGWIEKVMLYITTKVRTGLIYQPGSDPFRDLSLTVPRVGTGRGIKFFRSVALNWDVRRKVPRTRF